MNIPNEARNGFWIAIGVLAGMVAFKFVESRLPR